MTLYQTLNTQWSMRMSSVNEGEERSVGAGTSVVVVANASTPV